MNITPMKLTTIFQVPVIILSAFFVIFGAFSPFLSQSLVVSAAGSFNSNLIKTDSLKPTVDSDKKNIVTDVPMLSFLPFQSGNPRALSTTGSQNITFQIYYSNGGDARILNPSARVELIKETANRYRIRSTLTGSTGNVAALGNEVGISANSSTKGDDLIFSVPNDTDVSLIGNSTRIYRNALSAYPNYPSGISDADNTTLIADTTQNNIVSNPLYTAFSDKKIPESQGYKIADTLDSGAASYGYIVSKISVTSKNNSQNKAPTLEDQQITINKGTTGSFAPYACADQDGNFPCTYELSNLPSFCTNNTNIKIVSCATNSQTPALSTFTITPKDSTGLAGGVANFLISVIDSNSPNLSVDKTCVKKDTTNPCNTINLTKNDIVTYTIELKAQGLGAVKNIKLVDTYDKNQLSSITDTKPEGVNDANNGTVSFGVGDLNSGETKKITYNAKISESVQNGDKVTNKVKVTADNAPTLITQNSFTINLPGQPNLSNSYKSCFKKDTSTKCEETEINPGDVVTYKVIVKNSGTGVAYNVSVVDSYTKENYSDTTNAGQSGVIDTAAGTVKWQIGSLNGGESKELSFDAKINKNIQPGSEIVNMATIKADTYPDQTIKHSFFLFSSAGNVQSPRTGGYVFWTIILMVIVGGSGYYYYKKNNKISNTFVPERSKEDK
jgi:Domain of unknown function DUF11